MTNTTQSSRSTAWLALALLSITGCAGDDGVEASEASLDLGSCFGTGIVCDPAAAPSEELTLPAARSCDGELRAPLEREFLVSLPDLDDCKTTSEGVSCERWNHLSAFALGQDNVSWWLFTGKRALVARYDADGGLLGTTDLAALVSHDSDTRFWSADIELDERGHAFVVMHAGREADEYYNRGWFLELDPQGRPVRDPTHLGAVGYLHVARTPDGAIIAGTPVDADQGGLLAKLDRSGARVWSQTDVRVSSLSELLDGASGGVMALAPDDSDHAMVLTGRGAGEEGTRWGLMRFDPAGNALWDRVFDLPVFGGPDGLIAARDGAVVISASWSVGADVPAPAHHHDELVAHVRADGSSDWAYQFDGADPVSVTIHPESGDVYVSVTGAARGPFVVEDFLAVISADGEQCTRYAVIPEPEDHDQPQDPSRALLSGGVRDLSIDAKGRLYGTALHWRDLGPPGHGASAEWGLGRWRLPAE